MASITATVIAITKTIRGRTEAVPLNAILGYPTLKSVDTFLDSLRPSQAILQPPNEGGKHGFLLLVLTETKMRLVAEKP